VNCSSYFNWDKKTECNRRCGNGTFTVPLVISTQAGPFALKQCPTHDQSQQCNQERCYESFESGKYSFSYWPLEGVIGYLQYCLTTRQGDNFDGFIFDEENFRLYRADAHRTPAYNYGYTFASTVLNTDNYCDGMYLDGGKYYLVIDRTQVGANNPVNVNNDPEIQYTEVYYTFMLNGEIVSHNISESVHASASLILRPILLMLIFLCFGL